MPRREAVHHYAEDYDEGDSDDSAAVDDQYFESYGVDINVTRVMLADQPRLSFYDSAIRAASVRGKVVVDIGCGTGILSMMAARAGAKKVIGIDASDMAVTATHVVRANGFEGIVQIRQMRAEDLSLATLRARGLLGDDEVVDFIVSEWMGFYLLHENMLPSVVAARDALPGAKMIPSRAVLHAAPVDLSPHFEATSRSFWKNCAGFDLSTVGGIEEASILDANPLVLQMPAACQIAESFVVCDLNLDTITYGELHRLRCNHTVSWGSSARAREVTMTRPNTTLWGLGMWFTVFGAETTSMKSGPADAPTHWKQSVVLLPPELREQLSVCDLINDAQEMCFAIDMTLNVNSRGYEIELSLSDPAE